MKAVVAAFNQEKALVGAFSVITNLWMEIFEALMEDLRLWFLETRICRLWPNIVEESWAEFLAEDNRRAKRTLLEFLDSSHNHDILYFTRSAHMEERQVTHQPLD